VFDGKKIIITGGTGSLGQALTRRLLEYKVNTIRVFSRNESKQVQMESEISDERLRFFIGDVRDYSRLQRALEDIDIVFHTAALKHVPVVEYNPFEAIKTNVIGTQNVIDACVHENVEIAVGVGTDKAVSPLNSYGATKLLMEKLFVTASNYLNREKHRTKFITLRYGNVLGSSGSIVPKIINQIRSNHKVTITDPSMTRFSITMNQALDFILDSTSIGMGSEVFVPQLRAYTVKDVKEALVELLGDTGEEKIPIRRGEKMHETLINNDEMRYTWQADSKYMLANPMLSEKEVQRRYPNFIKYDSLEGYSSDKVEVITKDELKKLFSENVLNDI